MLPRLDGLEVCRAIRRTSTVPIVMLTARADTIDVVVGLEAGADDYVRKPFEVPELVARVRAALCGGPARRRRADAAGLLRSGRWRSTSPAGRSPATAEEVPLTRTEFDLLVDLARHRGRSSTRDTLLDRIWGYDYLGDSRLVDVAIGACGPRSRPTRRTRPDPHGSRRRLQGGSVSDGRGDARDPRPTDRHPRRARRRDRRPARCRGVPVRRGQPAHDQACATPRRRPASTWPSRCPSASCRPSRRSTTSSRAACRKPSPSAARRWSSIPARGGRSSRAATSTGCSRPPASMRDLVDDGQLAYAWTTVGGVPASSSGGRPAAGRRSTSSTTSARSRRASTSSGSGCGRGDRHRPGASADGRPGDRPRRPGAGGRGGRGRRADRGRRPVAPACPSRRTTSSGSGPSGSTGWPTRWRTRSPGSRRPRRRTAGSWPTCPTSSGPRSPRSSPRRRSSTGTSMRCRRTCAGPASC